MVRLVHRFSLGFALTAVAASAHAQTKLTPVVVFMDSAPTIKLLMLTLIAATLAAVVVTVRKVISGPHLAGGSAFISNLRLGGPLLGLLGGAYTGLAAWIGIANINQTVPLPVLAPGFAEIFAIFTLGLIAGVVAVICNWIVEARIDRAVLKA